MCGIVGIYLKPPYRNGDADEGMLQVGRRMLESLHFRGPDECHLVMSDAVVLGHTRLSIIDLSTGTQPIYNEDRTIAVILNGEIYNYRELRRELAAKGHCFRTHSDTEVIVHLYEEMGEALFSRLNGMFSILIHDRKKDLVLGARDRVGEKPFVYCETGTGVFFASEIKALLQVPGVARTIDPVALALYLKNLAVPAPCTIFSKIRKLQPAHYIKVQGTVLEIRRYWTPHLAVDWNADEKRIFEEFQAIFSEAVRSRTIADVPLGVFLSGGIDSSAVVAFMSRHCSGPVKTFSVGFGDEIDERPFARIVADRYQTQHTELFVDQKIEDVVVDVLEYFDEPFGDSSAVPTYLVAREARKHVKVVLTGDGGDELFAGYSSYLSQKYIRGNRLTSRAYRDINRLSKATLGKTLHDRWYSRVASAYAKQHLDEVRSIYSADEIFRMVGVEPEKIRRYYNNNKWLDLDSGDSLSCAYEFDTNYYLPDDLLKKVDMASMMTSLECRAPFLDHHLVEFAMKIPPNLKVKNDILKYVLKQSLVQDLPAEILCRPKTGFGAPQESWMRRQLKPQLLDYLAPGCHCESLIPRAIIDGVTKEFYGSERCASWRLPSKLWLLFVLEVWLRKYGQGS